MEWLPKALEIGISEAVFWTLNPRKIRPYIIAEENRIKKQMQLQNTMNYIQGIYFSDAIKCTIGNMFSTDGKKFEFPKEPYPLFENKKELSEEEKSKQVDLFFKQLEVMKMNFELEKQSGE